MNFAIFSPCPEFRYGVSTRADGTLNGQPSGLPARDAEAAANRRAFFARRNFRGTVFAPDLAHGSAVHIVTRESAGKRLRADGFLAATPGIVLTITVADCFPVFLYDPVRRVSGLAHGGWRGIVAGLVPNLIAATVSAFGSAPAEILLGIGPGIQSDHFVIRDDVRDRFREYERFVTPAGEGEYCVDLPGIMIAQAREKGVTKVEDCRECTYCLADRYFSYRRDRPDLLDVMLAYIGL